MGLFGEPLLRKFGTEHPPEWETGVGYLTDAQIDRGFRRLVFGWKGGPPSLPDFVRLCRSIGTTSIDDVPVDEGPQQFVALPPADMGKFDGWDLTANNRFWKYVTKRLTDQPRAWGVPGSTQQADATRVAVAYKNAWAQDMREADAVDTGSGEVMRLPRDGQDSTWVDAMKRAEADIVMFLAEKAA